MAVDEAVWEVIDRTMNELLPLALGIVDEALSSYDPVPFGIRPDEISAYAMSQFQKRLARIERARGVTLEEVCRLHGQAIENEDA
jgi:ribonucleoside-diphosphate reductase beta chain